MIAYFVRIVNNYKIVRFQQSIKALATQAVCFFDVIIFRLSLPELNIRAKNSVKQVPLLVGNATPRKPAIQFHFCQDRYRSVPEI